MTVDAYAQHARQQEPDENLRPAAEDDHACPELIEADDLVEDVSIDGMCGVY